MKRITNFDILIVYSGKLANSASSMSKTIIAPFPKGFSKESYNAVYSYFLKNCQKNNLKAAFSTSSDVIGAGMVKSYWLFENNIWLKNRKIGYSKMIFDKFSPTNKGRKISRNLLFSSKRIKAFNNPRLYDLCFDKQKTYNKFHKFSIPTVTIDGDTKKEVNKAVNILKRKITRHKNKSDFSSEIILKDRFGAGGNNVYKFKASQSNKMLVSIKKHKKISFIIQPFVKFNKGFNYKNSSVSTDIRLIYLENKIIQTYIRMAKKGDFRCNEHTGGLLKYISKNEVPSKVMKISRNIVKILNNKTSLFALDFIISNNGNVHLLEANTGPGLDWNLSIKENEIEAKKLIRIIIKEIVRRTISIKNTSKRKFVKAEINTPIFIRPYSFH